ncbi:hypothetical protein SH661x_002321 [Planctomicrobium sp. SH661]|uniref:hypothetical protein n=1 Tax=Planctomicrobium sp. SH661 TaxID=3448124 RepID=UPI003F5B9CD7
MTIGDMVVNLGLNRVPFSSGLNAARSELAGFGQSTIKSMAGIATGIVAGFAAVSGISAFKDLTLSAMQSVDETGELADTIGTTTEQLIGLQHAASLGGSSAEGLTKGMQKMLANVGAARQGIGSAKGVLDQFGLSANELAAQDPSQTFIQLAEKISQLPSASDRAAAAIKIFGKSGQEMLPMLSGGAAGIQAMMDEADKLGMTFSNVDSQKVAEANDAIDRMKGAVMGVAQQAAILLAPAITQVADGFTMLVPIAGQVFGFISDSLLTAFDIAGWAIANWQTIAEMAFVGAQLGVVTFGAEMVHFFASTLPEMLTWFGDNWGNIWRTALDLSLTMLINLGENIRSIFSSIWEFISSGGTKSLQLTWKPLTEGFVNAIQSLPQIPKREMGPLERQLNQDFARLGNAAGQSLQDHLDQQQKTREGVQAPASKAVEALPDIQSGKDKGESKASGPVAARVNTVEAYKLIQSSGAAQANARDQYLKKQLKATESQTGLLRQIAANTGDDTTEELDY